MPSPSLEEVSANRAFGGVLKKFKLPSSSSLGGLEAQFNVFIPEGASSSSPAPVLWYLAGLTCTEDTGAWKGGFIRDAAEHGLALLFPDTSPRGANIANEDDAYDFGSGAGFYIDATHPKWSKHYRMRTFLTSELPSAISSAGLPIDLSRQSIFGHSMGGHGALTLYLSLLPEGRFKSCSAFAPICNPTAAPWGQKAFAGPDQNGEGYLKGGVEEGKEYDAIELLKKVKGKVDILIDVGTADNFYNQKQLLPEEFEKVAKETGHADEIKVRMREGYDHSYYFISTYAPEHVAWHAKFLKK